MAIGIALGLPLLVWSFFDHGAISKETIRTIFIEFLMGFYWMTGCLPIFVTSMLPLFLFPFLGILSGDAVGSAYFNDTVFLFIGSFMIALAMERWRFDRRVSLWLVTKVGNRPRLLLLVCIMTSAFASIWMSSTGTTCLLLPLCMKTIQVIEEVQQEEDDEEMNEDSSFSLIIQNQVQSKRAFRNFSVVMLLAVCYSASIGGICSLIETGTNQTLVSFLKSEYAQLPDMDPIEWMIFTFPLAFVYLMLLWLTFCFIFVRYPSRIRMDRSLFQKKVQDMGSFKQEEAIILGALISMILIWCARGGQNTFAGWGVLFGWLPGDGTVAITIAFLLFIIPSKSSRGQRVLNWKTAGSLPWGIAFVIGSGFALAEGFGINEMDLTNELDGLGSVNSIVAMIIIVTIIAFTTGLTSSVAAAKIFLPFLASLSKSLEQNPLFLMIPAVLALNFGFMFPVASPANAIIFASGRLVVWDLVKAGVWITLWGILILPIYFLSLGLPIFGISIGVIPQWAVT